MTNKSKSNLEQKEHEKNVKSKKNYHSPHLENYGSLATVTKGASGPKRDGQSPVSKAA